MIKVKKPLGYWSYFKGNQKEIIKYILCIILCIMILGASKIILVSQQEELRGDFNDYYFMTRLEFGEWNDEAKRQIERVSDLDEVEGVYPYDVWATNCNMLFASVDEYTYFLDSKAIVTLVKRMDASFDRGQMPDQDSGGAIVSGKVVKSKGYQKGQPIDGKANTYMSAEYHCLCYSNFVPSTISEKSTYYMVIPVLGKMDEMNAHIRAIVSDDVEVWDLERIEELSDYMHTDVDENFNMIMMAITLMTSITVGGLTYFHYQGRRYEIKLLSDIGYSNRSLIGRMTKEIGITTLLAAAIAYSLLFILCMILNRFMNEPNGYECFKMDYHILMLVINIALFMMAFSVIPTWIMLGQKQQAA